MSDRKKEDNEQLEFFIYKIAFEIVSEPVSFMGLPQFNHFVQIVYVHVLMKHCDVIKQLNVDVQF